MPSSRGCAIERRSANDDGPIRTRRIDELFAALDSRRITAMLLTQRRLVKGKRAGRLPGKTGIAPPRPKPRKIRPVSGHKEVRTCSAILRWSGRGACSTKRVLCPKGTRRWSRSVCRHRLAAHVCAAIGRPERLKIQLTTWSRRSNPVTALVRTLREPNERIMK